MFVEITKETYAKLKIKLEEMGISCEVSDCTIPGENRNMVHLEFFGNLSETQIEIINDNIDTIDSEIIPKKDAETLSQITEKRRRTWDDKVHTPSQEAAAWFTGKNQEEEVTYELR